MSDKRTKKENYIKQLINYCGEYKKILVVNADNVGSTQFQRIRLALREKAVIVMGKNSMMTKGIKMQLEKKQNTTLEGLFEHMVGNIGFVFTNEDLGEVRDIILANRVAAPARAGAISPVKVVIPPQNTGLEPTKTSFFQALQIPTKITKGTVEIVNEVVILNPGDKVGNSESALLGMLNIKPFSYGLRITAVYDNGAIYKPEVLDLSEDVLAQKFQAGVNNIAALSLALGIPTEASVPHTIINSFKSLLGVAAVTDYSFKQAEDVKAYLADPSKFASAVSAAPAASSGSAAPAAAPKEEEKEEEEDLGFGGLF